MRAAYAFCYPLLSVPACSHDAMFSICLAQANGLKLKDFLANQDVAAFLLSDSVASLTFKAERFGANITTDQANLNSDEWFLTTVVQTRIGACEQRCVRDVNVALVEYLDACAGLLYANRTENRTHSHPRTPLYALRSRNPR